MFTIIFLFYHKNIMVRAAGLEPTNVGVRIPCLTNLATPLSNIAIILKVIVNIKMKVYILE